jgi:VWFA-related protein
VIGQDGRILGGLVFDSGKEQPVLYFGSGEEPLDLILLFDVSGSMLPKVKAVSEAAAEGMRELRPGDRVLLMAFNKGSRVILPFTDDLKRVEEAIRTDVLSLDFDGPTFLQDAVDDAATILLKQPRQHGRRAVLAITDNLAARTSRETAIIRRLWEADGILSGLVLYDAEWEQARKPGRLPKVEDLGVAPIVQKTGGDFIYSGDATSALVEAMRRIRTRYSLYYALPKAHEGQKRPIRVELTRGVSAKYPKVRVRARTTYIVPADMEP